MLFSAIASRDRATALRLVAKTPALARAVVETGDVFFDEITHYAYGGDTALHMAAAAYEVPIARELVSKGAYVRARTDAVRSHCTMRRTGFQDRERGIPTRRARSYAF